jgi:AcrR family transcriptional regulator
MAVDRKQKILEIAAKSFSLFGYKATTMDQVARLANVGKGTIYLFFKNKEELFAEIIASLIKEMKEEADKAFEPAKPFQQNLHQSLFQILEFRRKHQLVIKLFQEEKEMGTHEVLSMMEKLEEAVVHYINEKITEAVRSGEINECNPELIAFIMVKLYIALIFDWEKRHQPLEKDEISQLFNQYLFGGLAI